jgi:Ca2+-binding EF-hand superfamily protein
VNEISEITRLERVFEKLDYNNTTKITTKELSDAFHEYKISTSPEKIQ